MSAAMRSSPPRARFLHPGRSRLAATLAVGLLLCGCSANADRGAAASSNDRTADAAAGNAGRAAARAPAQAPSTSSATTVVETPAVAATPLAAPLVTVAPAARPDPVVEALRERLELLSGGASTGATVAGTEVLRASRTLPRLYQANGFRPLWDALRLDSLGDVLREVENDGLRPSDYHAAALERLRGALERGTPGERAALDLLATDAYALVLYHLYFGKVDPVAIESSWNFTQRRVDETEAIGFVLDRIRTNRIRESLSSARPDHFLYAAGRDALAQYRAIAALGGWPQIPAGATLRLGVLDARVPLLRERLALSGDLAIAAAAAGTPSVTAPANATASMSAPPADERFDEVLEAALRRFQRRHGLAPDGGAGAATLRALNVPVERRIEQIRVNLERGRWVLHEIGDGDLVIVDIAGFNVRYLRDRRTLWRARAQVGRPYRETPIFRSAIDHVVFNPTWTVPPGIVAKDILPELRRGAPVLQRKNLRVLSPSGRELDPGSIVVPPAGSTRFPYVLRQDPGPDNALGVVKIMFPNPYFVYLHDTPSRSLFEEDARAFSSGCIRVENPLDLVERLFASEPRWNRAAIDAAIAARVTRTVRLPQPVPVLMIYWTVDRGDDGSVLFRPDVYSRDAPTLAALDAPFEPGKRLPP